MAKIREEMWHGRNRADAKFYPEDGWTHVNAFGDDAVEILKTYVAERGLSWDDAREMGETNG